MYVSVVKIGIPHVAETHVCGEALTRSDGARPVKAGFFKGKSQKNL